MSIETVATGFELAKIAGGLIEILRPQKKGVASITASGGGTIIIVDIKTVNINLTLPKNSDQELQKLSNASLGFISDSHFHLVTD